MKSEKRWKNLAWPLIWQRRVRMFLDCIFSTDYNCTELLGFFSPAEPIKIYATKQEIYQYSYRHDLIRITEIGEAQAMMEMIKMKMLLIYKKSAQILYECTWIWSSGTSTTHSTAMLIN
jgi:hypothetical protein